MAKATTEIKESKTEETETSNQNMEQDNQAPSIEIPVGAIINYYLAGKGLRSRAEEAAIQFLLIAVAVTGGGLYFQPSKKYADEHGAAYAGSSQLEKEINYILGTIITALAVLYNSTDIFFKMLKAQQIPKELENYLFSSTNRAKILSIIIGAFFSSVPLILVSFAYPFAIESQALSIAIQTLFAGVVGIDNTILHFLPFMLAFQHRIFRFPIVPFELMYEYYQKYRAKKLGLEQPQPNPEAEAIRTKVIAVLQYAHTKVLLDNEFHLLGYTCKIPYAFRKEMQLSIKNEPLTFNSNSLTGSDHLKLLATQYPLPSNTNFQTPSCGYNFLKQAVGGLSAAWIWSTCAGYIVGPVNQFYGWTGHLWLAGLLSAPSIYFLSVLLTYLGYHFGKTNFEYVTSWGENDVKVPLEFRLSPIIFTLSLAGNIYLNLYGYAAAEQLIIDNFTNEFMKFISPFFIWATRTGVPFVGVNSVLSLTRALIQKYATYFGTNETKFVARLTASIEQAIMAMMAAKPDALLQSKKYLQVIGIVEPDKDQALKTESMEKTGVLPAKSPDWKEQISHGIGFWCPCLSSKSGDGESKPLLANPAQSHYTTSANTTIDASIQTNQKPTQTWKDWMATMCCWWRSSNGKNNDTSVEQNTEQDYQKLKLEI